MRHSLNILSTRLCLQGCSQNSSKYAWLKLKTNSSISLKEMSKTRLDLSSTAFYHRWSVQCNVLVPQSSTKVKRSTKSTSSLKVRASCSDNSPQRPMVRPLSTQSFCQRAVFSANCPSYLASHAISLWRLDRKTLRRKRWYAKARRWCWFMSLMRMCFVIFVKTTQSSRMRFTFGRNWGLRISSIWLHLSKVSTLTWWRSSRSRTRSSMDCKDQQQQCQLRKRLRTGVGKVSFCLLQRKKSP